MEVLNAVENSNTRLLQELLVKGHDVNVQDKEGKTALIQAVIQNSLAMVQLLMRRNPVFIATDSYGRNVMHYVCIQGNVRMCTLLLQACDLEVFDTKDHYGYTCLHYASAAGHSYIIDVLLENHFCDVNAITPKRETTLHLAVTCNFTKTVKTLLKHGVNVNRRNGPVLGECTAVILAAKSNKCSVLRLLLQAGADAEKTNQAGETALYCAAEKGYIQAVSLLLQYTKRGNSSKHHNFGACCMLPTKSALTIAALNCHSAVVTRLLQAGLFSDFCTAFLYAARIGHSSVIRAFINFKHMAKEKQDVKVQSILPPTWQRALFPASIQGHHKVVRLLVETGCDIMSTYPLNRTILHDVTREGHTKVIKILLRKGAKMDTKDSAGISPFMEAVRSSGNDDKVFRYYIEKHNRKQIQLDFQEEDYKQDTCLHLSAVHGNTQVTKGLLRHGCQCNSMNWLSRTPLHNAAKHSHPGVIRLLLEHGAYVDIHDKGKNTPLTLHLVSAVLTKQFMTKTKQHIQTTLALLNGSACTNEFSFFDGFVLTPLQATVKYKMRSTLKLLLYHGSHITEIWHPNFRHHLPVDCGEHAERSDVEWIRFVRNMLLNPMSLQQLCRCKIRTRISGNKGSKLNCLGLPRKLQHYVMLQDICD